MALTAREKGIFALAMTVAVLFTLDRLIVRPSWTAWERLDRTRLTKEIRLRKDRGLLVQKDDLVRQYRRFASMAHSKQSDQETMVRLLKDLESYARRNGVRIRDIKPQPRREDKTHSAYSVSTTLEGSWEAWGRFLRDIGRSPDLLRIEKLSLTSLGEGQGGVKGQILISKIGAVAQ